jgi:very-short-patch-repair endonuclease
VRELDAQVAQHVRRRWVHDRSGERHGAEPRQAADLGKNARMTTPEPTTDPIARAVAQWTNQLVDLGGRNSLLHHRDLRAGTLDLGAVGGPDAVESLLRTGHARLSDIVGEADRSDAARRCRAILAKAREMYEEKGVATLHLARDLVTWTPQHGSAVPAAPLVLVPMSLRSRTLAGDDHELAVEGPPEINPTLVHALRTQFRVEIDPTELEARLTPEPPATGSLDVVRDVLRAACAEVPGFAIAPRAVLGNFSYAKLPMVLDLEAARDSGVLASHDIVAAVAGDPTARERIRARNVDVAEDLPDHCAPTDEFCVLDADASQSHAINTVLGGEHLIIKGPPGTGKSQTISNLIAALTARGKKVLFVAEKRAAIDAVTKRLVQVGLGDLVLDVHGGVLAKRTLAQQLAAALQVAGSTPLPDVAALHAELEEHRRALNEHADALHTPRSPWGRSVFDLQSELLALADERGPIRVPRAALVQLDTDRARAAIADVGRVAELAGWGSTQPSPWSDATVVDEAAARAARDAAQTLASNAPAAVADLARIVAASGQLAPATVSEWQALLGRVERAREIHGWANPSIWALDLASLVADLAPAARNAAGRALATLTNGRYRSAKRALRDASTDDERGARVLAARAHAAGELMADWRAHARDSGASPVVVDPAPAISSTLAALDVLAAMIPDLALDVVRPADLAARGAALAADTAGLARRPELHACRTRVDGAGLGALLTQLEQDRADVDRATAAARSCIADSILDELRLADPTIAAFDARVLDRRADAFRAADQQHLRTTVARVRRAVAERIVAALDAFPDQAEIVQREAAKKTRHLPFRDLFGAAPDVLTAVKPCWAMSPLVVSQLLPTRRDLFDVVIFDEASQITPADAMPAIVRGAQLVVTGDDRQLPPTAFFSTSVDALDSPDDPEPELALTTGFESILDALSPLVGTRLRMLRWHYRSRDERLIAFSNVHFYDGALTTFPGALAGDVIHHELVAADPAAVVDEDSASAEVRRVVDLILDHARTRPNETLGVIAMGIKHADRVDALLRRTLQERNDADLAAFFGDERDEPFFVKNLERVQGDERDAIILTVGYGKSADGRLPYRFGPLLTEGGERRLNVAVTRAKRRLTLVSSFSALDMDPDRSTRPGVQLLRAYLEFAATGGNDLGPAASAVPPLNPFEISVRDRLVTAGIPLTAQFGVSGYRIDFAAMHPDQPGRPVLAIECDGASYHSQPTARVRDRLRQEHLERLGWTFHRVWSTAWFDQPEIEVQRCVDAWRAAVAENDAHAVERSAPPTSAAASTPTRGPRPAFGRRDSIDDWADAELRELLTWIESDTLLRTEDQLIDAMIDELGFARRGRRIVERLRAVLAAR